MTPTIVRNVRLLRDLRDVGRIARKVQAAADRILIGPEFAGEPIVDHHRPRRVLRVARVDQTAAHELRVQGLEVARVDVDARRRQQALAWLHRVPLGQDHVVVDGAGEGHGRRRAGRFDVRQRANRLRAPRCSNVTSDAGFGNCEAGSATAAVMTFSGSKPRSSRSTARKLANSRPAPTSRASATATCTTASPRRRRFARRLDVPPRLSWRSSRWRFIRLQTQCGRQAETDADRERDRHDVGDRDPVQSDFVTARQRREVERRHRPEDPPADQHAERATRDREHRRLRDAVDGPGGPGRRQWRGASRAPAGGRWIGR